MSSNQRGLRMRLTTLCALSTSPYITAAPFCYDIALDAPCKVLMLPDP